MRALILFLYSVIFASITFSTPAFCQETLVKNIFAPENPPSLAPAPLVTPIPDPAQLLNDASIIMGHIGVADIALIHEAYPEATANIKSALEALRDLAGITSLFNSPDPVRLANLSYFSNKEEQNFWLPVMDGKFVVRSMDGAFLKSKKPDAQVIDAQIVYYRISLNVTNTLERLEDAEFALKKKEYKNAGFALQEAIRGTYIDKFTHEDPYTATLDHLTLSAELIKDKNFTSATAALTHAESALRTLASTLSKTEKKHDNVLLTLTQVTHLKNRLQKSSDPTSLDIKEADFQRWAAAISALTTTQ